MNLKALQNGVAGLRARVCEVFSKHFAGRDAEAVEKVGNAFLVVRASRPPAMKVHIASLADGTSAPHFSTASARISKAAILILSVLVFFSCRQDMHDQPKYDPLEQSQFFDDQRSARPLVEGTVARGHLNEDPAMYTGKVNGALVTNLPFPVTAELLERGQQRFNIFCAPCHDQVGNGTGIVVRRGFRRPISFHTDRLRESPPGYYFDVMTNGFGSMSSYAEQVPVKDRWAIVAYIRALQLSQHASLEDVPEKERKELEAQKVGQ